jgi:hypothetical protein
MNITFEPTRSFCYKFGRYTVIPAIEVLPDVSTGASFRLREKAQIVIDQLLTPEQQVMRVKREQSDRTDVLRSIVKFFVAFLAREQNLFLSLGDGIYRAKTEADIKEGEAEQVALDAGDEEAAEYEGWIYAFSFPVLVQQDKVFPIKIGQTLLDVEGRVTQQCRGSASFENPIILGRWQVNRVGHTERAVHSVLKARSKWRENVPGTEWFDTTLDEIQAIIGFITRPITM